jgi:hypothetical protein
MSVAPCPICQARHGAAENCALPQLGETAQAKRAARPGLARVRDEDLGRLLAGKYRLDEVIGEGDSVTSIAQRTSAWVAASP